MQMGSVYSPSSCKEQGGGRTNEAIAHWTVHNEVINEVCNVLIYKMFRLQKRPQDECNDGAYASYSLTKLAD
jgi:hypothetical protein